MKACNPFNFKVFQLNPADCYMAETLEDAIDFALQITGLVREDYVDPDCLRTLTASELDSRRYVDEEKGYECSFREELWNRIVDHKEGPELFATTEI